MANEEVTTTTTEIAKGVMDPEIETEIDMHQVPGEDIIPTVKPRTQRKTATDVDAMIVNVIDPADMMTMTGRGAEGIVMRDQGVGHLKSSERGMGWQDQIDLGRGNGTEKEGIDGLHHLVGASLLFSSIVYA